MNLPDTAGGGGLEARAFSSEVDTGSREENASKQESRASVLILSEPALGPVEIQDSQIGMSVIQAPKGVWHAPIRFDKRPVGEDGAALFG